MTTLERAGYLSHSRLPVFRRRLADARECIAETFRLCERPYVSYSGGKDSAALLWLVLKQKTDIPVRICTWWETRYLHSNLDDCLDWWQERFPLMDLQEVREGFMPDGEGGVTAEEYGPARGPLRDVVFQSGDFDGVLLGLRSDESGNRALSHLYHRCHDRFAIHQYKGGVRKGSYRVSPLARWTVADVGALIALHGLPLLAAYESEGLSERTVLRLCDISMSFGVIDKLRRRDPASFNELILRSQKARRNH